MVTVYKCDRCGEVMDFDDERSVILSNPSKEKVDDLCPKCFMEVNDFIHRRPLRKK